MLDWLKKAFSDNGQPSSSRLLTALHSLAATFVLVYIAVKTRIYPDSAQGAALGGFATVHYMVNRITTAWGKSDKGDQDGK
jgi:hypothetical protein